MDVVISHTSFSEFGRAVCAGLGINPDQTRRIEIILDVDEAVTVKVTQYATGEQDRKLGPVIEDTFRAVFADPLGRGE